MDTVSTVVDSVDGFIFHVISTNGPVLFPVDVLTFSFHTVFCDTTLTGVLFGYRVWVSRRRQSSVVEAPSKTRSSRTGTRSGGLYLRTPFPSLLGKVGRSKTGQTLKLWFVLPSPSDLRVEITTIRL